MSNKTNKSNKVNKETVNETTESSKAVETVNEVQEIETIESTFEERKEAFLSLVPPKSTTEVSTTQSKIDALEAKIKPMESAIARMKQAPAGLTNRLESLKQELEILKSSLTETDVQGFTEVLKLSKKWRFFLYLYHNKTLDLEKFLEFESRQAEAHRNAKSSYDMLYFAKAKAELEPFEIMGLNGTVENKGFMSEIQKFSADLESPLNEFDLYEIFSVEKKEVETKNSKTGKKETVSHPVYKVLDFEIVEHFLKLQKFDAKNFEVEITSL